MLRSSLLFISFCLVLFAGNVNAIDSFGTSPVAPINPTGMPGMPGGPSGGPGGMPGMPPRQRDARPAVSEAVAAAQQEIETQLDTLLAAINQGAEPSAAELTQIAAAVKKNQQHLQKMDAKGQASLHLMNAWMNYFVGEFRKAKVAANLAYRADQQNKDAQTTYIIMAIANNDVKAAKTAVNLLRKKAAKPAAANQRPDAYGQMADVAMLEFDANSIKTELLGEKVGAFEAACLNGTSLPFKGGKTLLILLWKNVDLGTDTSSSNPAPQPMMMPGMPGMPGMAAQPGQTLTPLQAYGMLFARGFQNSKVAFLGLNLDAEDQSVTVMETLIKNSWLWPQAMAQDSRNAALALLTSAYNGKPAMVAVGPDGEIKYAGALSGFLLRVMAGAAQSGSSETTLALPPNVQKPEDVNTPATTPITETKETNDVNAPPDAVPQPKAQKSAEETLNPMATDLYQFALSQKRMAHVTGYNKMVEACRRILTEFPDTPEAAKARLLLREVPERKRPQYHITNEEMGL